jgi:hypothetical protein
VQRRARRRVGARPAVDRHRLLARRVDQPVGERDEVEEVVGVQVADDHAVDRDVVDEAPELAEDPVAAVEQHDGAVLLDQIPTARTARVRVGRGLAQHRDPHRSGL